ncbi:MAG: hypothetical protein FJX35_14825 [Alphaproteobacteria bacterium]|nr:hypothetical protein [Alphaproteobacteria bacterium]
MTADTKPVEAGKPAAADAAAPRAWTDGLSRAHLAQLTIAAVFVVAYVALERISFIHEYRGLPVTPWNPGLGVALALMIVGGARYGLALFAGITAAEIVLLQTHLDWPVILGIGAIISSGYALAARMAHQTLRLNVALPHLRDILVLLAVGIGGAALVSLLLGAILLAIGHLQIADFLLASGTLFLGDVIGIAVITPPLLRFWARWRERTVRQLLPPAVELMVLGAMIAAALWAIGGQADSDGFKLFYVLFLPVVVAAVRHGLDGACISLAATQLGLVGLLHLHEYDARIFAEFQILMFVLTATGLIVGVIVTERRASEQAAREAEAQLKEKQAEAAHTARFSLVSSMTSALAHEINQPMTAARALARSVQHILRGPVADLERADRNVTTLIAHIDRVGGIVSHMRDFLRRGRPHFSTILIPQMLGETISLASTDAASHGVRLELDVPSNLPPIHGDRIQLEQVLLNLVRNAIEAIATQRRTDGVVRIVARQHDAPARVEFAVIDNGPGIASELAGRLFEPFTTSKREGLGLGLSICASIVESHGGRIWLQGSIASATEFRFSLPLDYNPSA